MRIRYATIEDLDHLVVLFSAYRRFYGKLPDTENETAFLKSRLQHRDSELFVAVNDDGQLLGFVQLYPLFSSTRLKRYWLLNDLFVKETQRGKGISVQLIDRAKALVKHTKACGMYLETETSNHIGNNLYPKMGFKPMDDVNFYEWENDV